MRKYRYSPVCLLFFLILLLTATGLRAQNCTVNAGITQTICPGDVFALKGKMNGTIAVNAVWSQVSGPAVTIGTQSVVPNPDGSSNVLANVTGHTAGNTYVFRLSATCGDGSHIFQEVTYNTLNATLANAGVNLLACPGTNAVTLAGNAPAPGETGVWTTSGNAHGITINNTALFNSTVNVPATESGVSTLRWTLTNANGCTSSSDVTLTNGGGVLSVTAGSNTTLSSCYDLTTGTQLAGSYAGDGTRGQQGTWEIISGPTVATFDNNHVNNTTVRNLVQGTYVLRWTVSGPCVNGSSTVTITVPAAKKGITNAGNNVQTFCDSRTSAVLTGPVPGYTGESVAWTKTGGAGTIASPSLPSTIVTGLNGSTSTFQYTITNVNGCTSVGTYRIDYVVAPTITANSPVVLSCNATTASIPFTSTGGDQTQWTLVSAPAGAAIVSTAGTGYNNIGASPLVVSGLSKIGTYMIRLKRTTNNGAGGCGDAFVDVAILVSQNPTASNAGTQQLLACNVFNTNLAGNDPSSGTGIWSLVSHPAGSPAVTMTDATNPTTAISNLVNGVYTFRWIISGNQGCDNQQSDVNVVVANVSPTTSAAGTAHSVCNATPVSLTGNSPALNEVGTWTVSPSAGVTIANNHDPNTTVTGLQASTAYTFTWTINNSCGTSSSDVVITTTSNAGPQQASAIANSYCFNGNTVTLTGNAPGSGETGFWTIASLPASGAASIGTITPVTGVTNVTLTGTGTYKFQWNLDKNAGLGCVPTSAVVIVTKSAGTTVATVGADMNVCGTLSGSLGGNTPASTETGTWSQVAGPGGAVITSAISPTTTVSALTDGRYTFRWTISNGGCAASFADIHLTVATAPLSATAGSDHIECNADGSTTYALGANNVAPASGLWTIVSGPNNPTFSSYTANNAVISNLKTGVYNLRWTSSTGFVCPVSSSGVQITVVQKAKASVASTTLCSATSIDLRGNEGNTGSWAQVGTTPNTATINNTSGNSATASGLITGTYTFRYTVPLVSGCTATTDDETVTISGLPSAAVITNVTDENGSGAPNNQRQVCIAGATTQFTLNAQTPATGTGTWSVLSAPAGTTATLSAPGSATTNYNTVNPGSYLLAWNVSNGACGTNQEIVRLLVDKTPVAADAGSDQPNACNSSVTLAGNTPDYGIGTWTLVSGPNTPTIDQPNTPNTKILGTVPGTYVFRWTIANVCASTSDDVTVTVSSTPPTTAIAGTAQELCSVTTTVLSGNATAVGEAGTWSSLSGPNTPTFVNQNLYNTQVNGLVPGTYQLQWSISKGSCVSNSTVQILVNATASTAVAGSTQSVCLYTPLTLNATAPAIGTGTWSVVAKPGTLSPVFTDVHLNNTTVNSLEAGSYTFRWTVANGNCPAGSNFSDVNIAVTAPASSSVVGASQTACQNSGITLNGNNPAVGSGIWTFESGPATPTITTPAAYNSVVTGLTTAGTYIFTWTITNGTCATSSSSNSVLVLPAIASNTISGDQTICYNTAPTVLTGSSPTGGNGTYTYQWKSSPTDAVYTNVSSGNGINYTSAALTANTYFKRYVTSGACTVPDISATPVLVTVKTQILPATPTLPATNVFCVSGDPAAITGGTATGGDGSFTYLWQQSTNNTTFSTAGGTNNTTDYDPSTISVTTYYRRQVTSDGCTVNSPSVQMTIQAALVNNIAANQQICVGSTPAAFTGTPSGGSGSYTYRWESSTDNSSFNTIATAGTGQTYTAPQADFTTPVVIYYRRVLSSGACPDHTSASVNINSNPVIDNSTNVITAPTVTVTCSGQGQVFSTITGTDVPTLSGGNGVFTFQWQSSTTGPSSGFTNIPSATGVNYVPDAGFSSSTKWVQRIAQSGGCSATTSAPVQLTVQAALGNNVIGSSQVLCGTSGSPAAFTTTGSSPTGGDGSTYAYQWQISTTSASTGFSDIGGAVGSTYDGSATTVTQNFTYYRRTITSGACTVPNNSTAVTVRLNPFAQASDITVTAPTVTYGSTIGTTASAPSVTSPQYKWYTTNVLPATALVTGGTVTVTSTALTGTLSLTRQNVSDSKNYYVTVRGANFCENTIPATVPFTINKATLVVNADAQTKTYGDANPALTSTIVASGFKYSDNATNIGLTGSVSLNTTATAATHVASSPVSITLSGSYASPNYNFTYNNSSLTINKAPLTVTAADQSKTYDGSTYPSAGASNSVGYAGFVNGESAAALGGTLSYSISGSPVNPGTYNTTIVPAGYTSSDYNISFVAGKLTIGNRPVTYTAPSLHKTYGTLYTFATDGSASSLTSGGPLATGDAITASAVTSSGALSNATVGGNPYATNITPGSIVIRHGATDVTSFYTITLDPGVLTVDKAAIVYKANDDTKQYGLLKTLASNGTGITLNSGTLAGGDAPTAAVLSSTGTPVTASVAGSTYPISLSGVVLKNGATDVTANYDISYLPGALTVTPAPLTYKANDASKTYGDLKVFAGVADVSLISGTLYNSDAIGSAVVSSAAGSPITATVAGSTYPISITQGSLTIRNGATDVSSNYSISLQQGALTVLKAPLVISAAAATKTYDNAVYAGTYSSGYSGFVNGETASTPGVFTGTLTYTGTSQTGKNVGTYVITPGGLTASNYNISYVNNGLSIVPAALTITAGAITKVYDGSVYGGAFTSTYAGFVPGDNQGNAVTGTLAYSGTSQTGKNAGTYVITPGGQTAANYTISYINGPLTITPRPLTITANDQSKTYDGLLYGGTYTITSTGYAPGENIGNLSGSLLVSGSSQTARNAGNYVITPGGYNSSNYTISFVNGNLQINPRPVTLTAYSTSKKVNHLLNLLSNVTVTAGSLVPGDVVSNAVLTSTGAGIPAPVGAYPVNITPGSPVINDNGGVVQTPNYTITLVPGTLTVVPNINPVAGDDSRVTSKNVSVPVPVLPNDSDADGVIDITTVEIVTPPAHGSVTVNSTTGVVTYTPALNYHGTDVFTYKVKDDDGGYSNIANVTITILEGPAANNNMAVTNPDTPVTLDILADDIAGDAALVPSTVTILTGTTHGTVTVNTVTGAVTYTPDAGYFGTDQFTYTVKDANGVVSNIATGTIRINKPPVANNDNAVTRMNIPVTLDILVNDVKGDGNLSPVTVTIITPTAHGTVTVNTVTGKVTYTPNNGYFGTDQFIYTVKDVNGAVSNHATGTIVIHKPPVANDNNATTHPSTPVTIDILANDVPGDGTLAPGTLQVITPPSNGNISINPSTGKITYLPNPGFYGNDTLTYTIKDINGEISNIARVVVKVNKPPVAVDDSATTPYNTPVTIGLLVNDVPGDGNLVPATVTVLTQPSHGTVSIDPATGKAIYTPAPGYSGTDHFTYTVTDGNGIVSNVATATIIINKPPVANNDNATTRVDVPVTLDLPGNDQQGTTSLDPASVRIIVQPQHGTVSIDPATGNVIYTPAPGYFGTDSFTYTVKGTDGSESNIATGTITIQKPPVAGNDVETTEVDVPVTVTILANDQAFGSTLNPGTVVIITPPAHGTVAINPDGTVKYTPATGYEGQDSFTYTIKDQNGNTSNVAIAVITIVNKKPDLNLVKKLVTPKENIKVGHYIDYEIEVANLSTTAATNVVVTDALPSNLGGTTVTQTVPKGTAGYNTATKTVTWNIPTLAGGEKLTMKLTVQVTAGGKIVNLANVTSSQVDGNPANNQGTSSYEDTPADSLAKEDLFLPNVITPNGDGKNDYFLIPGLSRYPNAQLLIYNRWGNMVYHSDNYDNKWNGSGLNEGTYYYVLVVIKPGGKKQYNGWVQLIR